MINIKNLRLPGAIFLMLVAASVTTGMVSAATTFNLNFVGFGYGDYIMNYDFENQRGNPTKVDWAVSLLFYNNANVNKVKRLVRSVDNASYQKSGSNMNGNFNNGSGWKWDQDGGAKDSTPLCLGESSRHFRIYASPTLGYMYNPNFGYYVYATTHRDHNEIPGCGAFFDDSEGTEHDVALHFSSDRGYYTRLDYANFYNYENRIEGNHRWNNDGYASYIKLT